MVSDTSSLAPSCRLRLSRRPTHGPCLRGRVSVRVQDLGVLRTETCQLLTALPQAGVSAPPSAPGAPGSCKVSAEMGEQGVWGPQGPAPPAPSRSSPGAEGQGCRGDRIPLKIQDLSLGRGSKDRFSS